MCWRRRKRTCNHVEVDRLFNQVVVLLQLIEEERNPVLIELFRKKVTLTYAALNHEQNRHA